VRSATQRSRRAARPCRGGSSRECRPTQSQPVAARVVDAVAEQPVGVENSVARCVDCSCAACGVLAGVEGRSGAACRESQEAQPATRAPRLDSQATSRAPASGVGAPRVVHDAQTERALHLPPAKDQQLVPALLSQVRTQRSATAFALGAPSGVLITPTPSRPLCRCGRPRRTAPRASRHGRGSGSNVREPPVDREVARPLKRYLAKQTPAGTLLELQCQLDTLVHYYTHIRPHRAIGRRTPCRPTAPA
jgi:hypothetical protein